MKNLIQKWLKPKGNALIHLTGKKKGVLLQAQLDPGHQ